MEAATGTTIKSSGRSIQIDLPALKINISSLQLPDTIVTKTVVKSQLKGAVAKDETKEIPFSAEIKISGSSPQQVLKELGLAHTPREDCRLSLSVDGEGAEKTLAMKIASQYDDSETRYKSERYDQHYVPAGQHAPYGPVEPGYWDYKTREVPYQAAVVRSQNLVENPIKQSSFNQIYLGILNSADSESKTSLLDFLHKQFGENAEVAQCWIGKELKAKVEKAREAFEEQARGMEGLQLPKIGRR